MNEPSGGGDQPAEKAIRQSSTKQNEENSDARVTTSSSSARPQERTISPKSRGLMNSANEGMFLDTHNEEEGLSFGRSSSLPPLSTPHPPRHSVTSTRSINVDDVLADPALTLSRSSSRQTNLTSAAPQVPAWLSTEMTALGVPARSSSVVSRATTPRQPLATRQTSETNTESQILDRYEEGDATTDRPHDVYGDEGSRMLRHLEQHEHLQEEMQNEQVMNPNRAEQIQRENHRLLHIAMRRDRNARRESKGAGGVKSPRDEGSPPLSKGADFHNIVSPLVRSASIDIESLRSYSPSLDELKQSGGDSPSVHERSNVGGAGEDSPQTPEFGVGQAGSRKRTTSSSRRRMENLDLLSEFESTTASANALAKKISSRRLFNEDDVMLNHEDEIAQDVVELSESPSKLPSSSTADVGAQDKLKGEMKGKSQKPVVMGFGALAAAYRTGSSENISSQRKRGFGYVGSSMGGMMSSRRNNNSRQNRGTGGEGKLPVSFGGGRQRQRLLALIKDIDLADATLWDAMRKIRPLHPLGWFRTNWDRVLALAVVYTLVVVPLEVAYSLDDIALDVIGFLLDFVFIVDVFLCFRTSYKEINDEYVRDFAAISKHYLRTWFIFDLIAAIPVNMIFAIVSAYVDQDIRSYFSLIKLIKVFRIVRLRHLFYALAGLRTSVYIYLILFVGCFVTLAHWVACMFWKIADLENDQGNPSWATLQTVNPDIMNSSIAEQYALSIYWSMATISTLGYGDIRPRTYPEQIYASLIIIIGAAMYAAVIGLVSYIMRSQFETELQRENHIDNTRTFGRQYHLPPKLQERIQQYFEFLWQRKKRFTSKSLVDELPLELRADVADAVHKKLMEINPVLRACNTFGFRKILAARLTSSTVRIPDDMLYFEGDEVSEVFFIKKGLVDIVFGLDRGEGLEFPVARRADKQYLGDIGLFVASTGAKGSNAMDAGSDANLIGEDEDSLATEDDDINTEGAQSEEETEASGAAHFVGSSEPGSLPSRQPKTRTKPKVKSRRHHTSALVVQFSEISSILAADFLQLLNDFPYEKALFKAVALARFQRIKQVVAARLGLDQQPESTNIAPHQQDQQPNSSLSASRRFFSFNKQNSFADRPPSSSVQLPEGERTSWQASPQSATNINTPVRGVVRDTMTSPRLRETLTKPFSKLIGRQEELATGVATLITPEEDDALARDAISAFLAKSKVTGLGKKHAKKKEKNKKQFSRASRLLASPVARMKRTMSTPMIPAIPVLGSNMQSHSLNTIATATQVESLQQPASNSMMTPQVESLSSRNFNSSNPSLNRALSEERRSRSHSEALIDSDLVGAATPAIPASIRRLRRMSLTENAESPAYTQLTYPQSELQSKRRPPPLQLPHAPPSPFVQTTTGLNRGHSQFGVAASPTQQTAGPDDSLEMKLRALLEKVNHLDSQVEEMVHGGAEANSPSAPGIGKFATWRRRNDGNGIANVKGLI